MQYKTIGNTIVARLEIGEEIIASVEDICGKEKIKSGVIHAIGAVSSAEIAMFDFKKGEYCSNNLDEFMELISLEGNISKMNGETYIHLHASFGDKDGKVFGGHLKKAVIGATCEMFVTPLDEEIVRIHDEKTGLNIFSL